MKTQLSLYLSPIKISGEWLEKNNTGFGPLVYLTRKEALAYLKGEDFDNEVIRILKGFCLSMADISQRDRDILIERFGLLDGKPKSLKKVGELFDVTAERIRQRQQRFVEILKDKIESQEV